MHGWKAEWMEGRMDEWMDGFFFLQKCNDTLTAPKEVEEKQFSPLLSLRLVFSATAVR